MSGKALLLCAHELEKLANGLGRPLADEVFAVAAELKQRADTAADIEQRREVFRQAPSRSGAAGSTWARLEKSLMRL